MTRNLKALGLALVAVFAMSAVMASAASAAPEFTAFGTEGHENEHVKLYQAAIFTSEASESSIFTATGGFTSINCSTADFEGTDADGKATTLQVSGQFGPTCTATGGLVTHVTMNGCELLFHVTEKVEEDKYKGTSDIVNCSGAGIHVVITNSSGGTKCTVDIGNQTGIGPIYFEDNTGTTPTDVTVNAEATNVKNTTSGGVLNCGAGNGEHTNGTYFGKNTVRAYEDLEGVHGEQIDAEVSG